MTETPLPVVLDADTGIDDAVALALAARSPELRLVAVTATYGNACLTDTASNARRVLALAGRPEIPVLPGAERPLVRPPPGPSEKHGERGIGYAPGGWDGGAAGRISPQPDALLRVLAATPEPVVLLSLGPLTNLALALDRDEAMVRARVRRHLAVIDGERTDFNSSADPEAADRVFAAGLSTEVVAPAVTRRLVLTGAAVTRLGTSREPLVRWLTDALRWYVEVHERLHGLDGCWVHDAVAVAEAVWPGTLDFESPGPEIGARVARHLETGATYSLLDRVFGAGWNGPPTGGAG
jgi:pyrimidine-specific ribonucleoside hydrolase